MKQIIAAMLASGLFVGSASAKNCTLSNEFQINRSQVMAGVLEDPFPLPLPGFKLELVAGRGIKAKAVTVKNGEYSLGEVPAGHYRIHLRRSGNPFCAPTVECNHAGSSIQRQVKLNPKNIPVTVY